MRTKERRHLAERERESEYKYGGKYRVTFIRGEAGKGRREGKGWGGKRKEGGKEKERAGKEKE